MRFRFEPAIPAFPIATPRQVSYAIDLDRFHDLITGSLSMESNADAIALTWNPAQPEWARAYALKTTIAPDPDHSGYSETTARADAR